MDILPIKNAKEQLLNIYPIEIVKQLSKNKVSAWFENVETAEDISRCLLQNLEEFYIRNSEYRKDDDDITSRVALECFVFDKVYEKIMPQVYERFEEDDEYLFEKSKLLANMRVTAEQFGGSRDHAVHLSAAIVELASLDNHKSPTEKLNCLCTTYDLIFAELKSAIIRNISKYSENESDIPVINNSDIIPVLVVVLIRSKLVHLASNLFYIECFLWAVKDEEKYGHVLCKFVEATDSLRNVTQKSLKPGCEEVCRSLDLEALIELTVSEKEVDNSSLILKDERERICNLIIMATDSQINSSGTI